jgi:hypothetical protein
MDTKNPFDVNCSVLRTDIKAVGGKVKELLTLMKAGGFDGTCPKEGKVSDNGEMIANITLAFRHLEDAAMRVGKGIQAWEGGEGIYDNNDAKRVAKAE